MQDTMIASEAADHQEVQSTEPAVTEENQTQDYWNEDFTPDEPVTDTEPEKEVTEEAADEKPDYITEGLGKLDKPMVIKYKGKLYDIDDKDKVRDLMERGMAATSKLQEIAELKKELLKAQHPDASDKELQSIDVETEVETIAQSIVNSPIAEDFKGVIAELPEEVATSLRSDPQMLRGLKADVEAGFTQKILPAVNKYMAIEGLDFRSAYVKAGNEVMQSEQQRDTAVTQLTAAPTKTGSVQMKERDIWDISDDEFRSIMATERR